MNWLINIDFISNRRFFLNQVVIPNPSKWIVWPVALAKRTGGPEERRNGGPEERRTGGPEERRTGEFYFGNAILNTLYFRNFFISRLVPELFDI